VAYTGEDCRHGQRQRLFPGLLSTTLDAHCTHINLCHPPGSRNYLLKHMAVLFRAYDRNHWLRPGPSANISQFLSHIRNLSGTKEFRSATSEYKQLGRFPMYDLVLGVLHSFERLDWPPKLGGLLTAFSRVPKWAVRSARLALRLQPSVPAHAAVPAGPQSVPNSIMRRS
jgi:hypothetical protein